MVGTDHVVPVGIYTNGESRVGRDAGDLAGLGIEPASGLRPTPTDCSFCDRTVGRHLLTTKD